MRIELTLLSLFFVSCSQNVRVDGSDITPFFSEAKDTLFEYNLVLPDELLLKLKNSKSKPARAAHVISPARIIIEPTEYPGEEIDYAVGLQEEKPRGSYDYVFNYFFYKSELRMIASVSPYVHNSGLYEFGGFVKRRGRVDEFKDGKLFKISCLHKPNNVKQPRDILKKQYCGDQIEIDANQNILNVKNTGEKCVDDCVRGYPYRFPGPYYAMGSIVNMRSTPTLNGEVIAKLPRGEKVEVVEDTGKRDYLPNPLISANWLKVKTSTGQEGYIHGAYLRAPAEPDIYEIKRKAEEWKKANKR